MSDVVSLVDRRSPGWPRYWPNLASLLREVFGAEPGFDGALAACEPKLRQLWEIHFADYNLGKVTIPNTVSREAAAEVAGVIEYALRLKGEEFARRAGDVLWRVADEYMRAELAKRGPRAPEALPRRAPPSNAPASVRQWRRHVEAGERVAELLGQLGDRLAGLPGGDKLQYLLTDLEDEIAACDAAAWRAIHALEGERDSAH